MSDDGVMSGDGVKTKGRQRQRLGRWSLRLDTAHCALVGAVALMASGFWVGELDVAREAVIAAGLAVVTWAVVVATLARREDLRTSLWLVLMANVVAVAGLGVAAITARSVAMAIGLGTIAADVAIFARTQAAALAVARRCGG